MVVMRLLLLMVLAGCWRGGAAAPSIEAEPPSFVVRLNALADLQRRTAALAPRLAAAAQRIFGLIDEAQRTRLRHDLRALADDVDGLVVSARTIRARGADAATRDHVDPAAALDEIDRKLTDARGTLAKLRHGLSYANTLEQLQAYERIEDLGIGGYRHVGVADFNVP
jgi:hypothetical protein